MKKNFKKIVVAAFIAMTVAGSSWAANYCQVDGCKCRMFVFESNEDFADFESRIKSGRAKNIFDLRGRYFCKYCPHDLINHKWD